MQSKKVFTTDWLNLHPVFYNTKTLDISHNINDVMDYSDLELDPEGFNNYLDFGYSVFGQTPIKNVKFLFPCQKIEIDQHNLVITDLEDPIYQYHNHPTTVSEVLEKLEKSLDNWQKDNRKIILPLSGGFDSRLLLKLLNKDQSDILAYTYGLSPKQNRSIEVINAQIEAENKGVKWKQIKLGYFHNYIEDWFSLMGSSVHLHGMYQVEFYKEIKKHVGADGAVLSGIIGDAWAGGINTKKITNYRDLIKLGYTHGISSSSDYSKLKSNDSYKKKYWDKIKKEINDPYFQTIYLLRIKMILLSYLFRVPENMGFKVWSPFIEPEIALAMLNLPVSERKNRCWQKRIFPTVDYSFNQLIARYTADRRNTLELQAYRKVPLQLLDVSLLEKYVDRDYLEKINLQILKIEEVNKMNEYLMTNFWIGGIFRKVTHKQWGITRAYNTYRTLKSIEIVLNKVKK